MTKLHVLLLVVLCALVSHSVALRYHHTLDSGLWIRHAKVVFDEDRDNLNPAMFAYPAGPLMTGIVLTHGFLGINTINIVLGVIASLSAIAIAFMALIARLLEPERPLWLALTILLIFNKQFLFSTPPSSLTTPILVGLFLLSLLIYKNKLATSGQVLSWGFAFGIAVGMRADISLFIGLPLLALLYSYLKIRQSVHILMIAGFVAIVMDVYFWMYGLSHLGDMINMIQYHYSDYGGRITSFPPILLLFLSPIANIGMLVGLGALISKNIKSYVPRSFLAMLLFLMVAFGVIVSFSQIRHVRYFYPFAVLWETILILELFRISKDKPVNSQYLVLATPKTVILVLTLAIILAMNAFSGPWGVLACHEDYTLLWKTWLCLETRGMIMF